VIHVGKFLDRVSNALSSMKKAFEFVCLVLRHEKTENLKMHLVVIQLRHCDVNTA